MADKENQNTKAEQVEQPDANTPPEDFNDYEVWKAAKDRGEDPPQADKQSGATLGESKEEAESAGEADTTGKKETETDEEGSDDDKESNKPDGKRRKGGFQRRIDNLTRDKRELEERLSRLESRLAGDDKTPAESGTAGDEGKGEEGSKESGDTGKKPSPEDFDTYEEFTEALLDWKDQQRQVARQEGEARAEAERRQAAVFQSWSQRMDAARQAHDDFDEIVDQDIPVTQAMQQAMLDSEQGAELAYYLGSKPEEAERIAKLSPVAQIRELGKLEVALSGGSSPQSSSQPKPTKRISSAPTPPTRLSGKAGGGGTSVYDESLADDFNAWEAERNRQLRRR